MMEERKRRVRKWPFVAVLLLSLLVWLWARTGKIEVVQNAAALQTVAAKAEGTPAEFTVLTYNVQARPVFDDSKHKFKYISPLLNAYDICAFQECFKDHERLWEAAVHSVKIYHGTLRNPLKVVGSGLSILGKFPLAGTEGINYSDPGDFQNWPASKGALLARFLVNGMPLDVYTTHIAAGKKARSRTAKLSQTNELIKFVRSQSPADHSVVLMADFNMRPSRGPEDREAHKDDPKVFVFDHLISELGMRDASDEVNGPTGTEIDRILFRPGKGYAMKPLSWQRDAPDFYDPEKKPLSDHKPVFVRFSLAKE